MESVIYMKLNLVTLHLLIQQGTHALKARNDPSRVLAQFGRPPWEANRTARVVRCSGDLPTGSHVRRDEPRRYTSPSEYPRKSGNTCVCSTDNYDRDRITP